MPATLQVKLLRVLQERKVRPVGGQKETVVDVRLVAATNRDIDEEVRRGTFREDLFFRLNVIRIHLPPLRERREDIPALTRHFVKKVSREEGHAEPIVLTEALEELGNYDFPGNVRELLNLVERAVALSSGRPIGPEIFRQHLHQGGEELPAEDLPEEGVDLEEVMASVERKLLEQALVRANGVKKDAARLLGISFRSFRYRLMKHKMG